MEKYIYDKKSGLHYKLVSNYYLPCFEAPQAPQIGVWGERRRRYLRKHEKTTYTAMLLSETLNAHLEEVDRSASEMFDRLVTRIAEREGITEQLKAANPMEWVQRMNDIRSCVIEIVSATLIYKTGSSAAIG